MRRSQRRGLKATAELLGESVEVAAYARGRARPHLPKWFTAVVFTYSALVVFPTSVIAGLVVAAVVAYCLWPDRAVAVANGQLALLSTSNWSGKHAVIGFLPVATLQFAYPKVENRMQLPLGPEVVTLRRRDLTLLAAAAGETLDGRGNANHQVLAAPLSDRPAAADSLQPGLREWTEHWLVVCVGAVLLVGGGSLCVRLS
jgi:hypothetical protein